MKFSRVLIIANFRRFQFRRSAVQSLFFYHETKFKLAIVDNYYSSGVRWIIVSTNYVWIDFSELIGLF